MADHTPADLGYSMPAEWEPHAATWLGWPHNESDWPDKLDTIRWVYAEMVRKISKGELVRILVRNKAEAKFARSYLKRAHCDLKRVQFVVHPTNRGWTRDSGPIHVTRNRPLTPSLSPSHVEGFPGKDSLLGSMNPPPSPPRRGAAPGGQFPSGEGSGVGRFTERVAKPGEGNRTEKAIVHFHFNAWAKYKNWQLDTRVPETAACLLKRPLFDAQFNGKKFVIEGGGIEVNGRGTLLTTEECYQHPTVQVRNPGMTKEQYDDMFERYLGVNNVRWLLNGPVGDDTHGHIDDVCRFVNAKTLVLIRETNKRDINFKPLAENWERVKEFRLEDGSRPEIIPLPMPSPLYYKRWRLPASYANFYVCNACVIVPTFNDVNDRVALGILGELFKNRPVVGIHAVDLVLGFGSLHCLTQQEPA